MTTYNYLQLRRDGPVLIATMSNPPKNFLNAPMVAELHQLADQLKDDAEVRALILTGGVHGIFITHYDVRELSVLADRSHEQPAAAAPAPGELHTMHQLILKLQALPQPVIAAINGTAMGGGCELAIGCDFRLMSTDGVIGCPEVRVGILPGAGGTQRITRLVGVAKGKAGLRALRQAQLLKYVRALEAATYTGHEEHINLSLKEICDAP